MKCYAILSRYNIQLFVKWFVWLMLCSFTFLWLMPCCLTCSNQYLKVNLNEHLQVMTKYIFLTSYPIVFNCTAISSVTTRDKKPYQSTKSNITLFISAIIDSCMSYLSINTLARAESRSSPRLSRSSLHLENACRYLSGFYSSVCHTVWVYPNMDAFVLLALQYSPKSSWSITAITIQSMAITL